MRPNVLVVYAGMSRAFSLLRILRRSADMAEIPLIVVGEPEQEELIAKHRKLPSRADRYLLRPLDGELVRSVVAEYLGDEMPDADIVVEEKTPPPLPGKAPLPVDAVVEAPDAYSRVEQELHRYQARVKELEKDLKSLMNVSKENAALREELTRARVELAARPEVEEPSEDYNELFARLEDGYKETIDDMERLLQEKDDIIARLAASEGASGEDVGTLTKQLEREQERYSEILRGLRTAVGMLDDLARTESEVGLEDLLLRVARLAETEEELRVGFSFDEETVIVDAADLQRNLDSE